MTRLEKIRAAAALLPERKKETLGKKNPGSLRSLPCVHLGEPTGETVTCPSCKGGGTQLKTFACAVHGVATIAKRAPGVTGCCKGCRDRKSSFPNVSGRTGAVRLDETNLYPGLPGRRFNPGLIEWEDGYVFCWRDGWKGSDLWVCRMDKTFAPVGDAVRLRISHPEANYGREDPALFVHNGSLHVAFVGVVGAGNKVLRTSMLYARLSPSFGVEAVYAPKAPGVIPSQWQKNWQWFSQDGSLYAIYTIAPHRVLRVTDGAAIWAHQTPTPIKWIGGEMRGGATPLRVGSEYWSFFHDSVHPPRSKKVYRVGLYTFSARAPFPVTGYVPNPIMEADRSALNDNYCHVLFPRGVVINNDTVTLSCGVHDRYTELQTASVSDLARRIVRVPSAGVLPDVPSNAVAN